jgi:TolB-like protein
MSESRKLAAIMVSDVVGYSRLAGADEDRILVRLRTLRSDLIDPTIAVHHGRVVKRTGDGSIVEFRSVVDAVRCAIEVQNGMRERNAGVPDDQKIQFRVGVHVGDVVEEADGDLMGDGVNIAARLEGVAKPGAICLSEDAYRQVKGRLDLTVTDLGATQLKNIAEPIHVYSLEPGVLANAKQPVTSPAPPRLSLVVLPFANIGGDTEQDYFVDGVTESLTTDLSRIRSSFVIGRHTAFTYKGKVIDVKQIGRELNVRYVLEGSVQRGGGRMRVNVQLIDAESGSHLWAERFDKPVADLFDMQDEIVARLAGSLNAELITAEARRAEQTPNPDTIDLCFLGLAQLNKGYKPENLSGARSFVERALAVDPDNILALILTASIDLQVVALYQTDDRAGRLSSAEAALSKVLSLAPGFALGHHFLGFLQSITNRAGESVSAFERALALDRNLATAHSGIGASKMFVGRAEETEPHVLEALRLSPRDRLAFIWFGLLAQAKLCIGADEEAVNWSRRSIELNRNYPLTHVYLAAALALLGRVDEARAEVQTVLALDPKFTIRRFRAGAPSANSVFLKQRERVIEGMRKAGLPEG